MIDWQKFGERVKAGTMIRYEPEDYYPGWVGILLENTPCPEEDLGYTETVGDVEYRYTRYVERPLLRMQDFEEEEIEWVQPLGKGVQYLINGEWLTYEQVMA